MSGKLCDNMSGTWCKECRETGASHCGDPVNCGGMKPMTHHAKCFHASRPPKETPTTAAHDAEREALKRVDDAYAAESLVRRTGGDIHALNAANNEINDAFAVYRTAVEARVVARLAAGIAGLRKPVVISDPFDESHDDGWNAALDAALALTAPTPEGK